MHTDADPTTRPAVREQVPVRTVLWLAALLSASTSAAALEPQSPQAQFDAFIERCARIQSPAVSDEAVEGIQLGGLRPVRYIEADGPDGSAWGFVFDLSIDAFRTRFPALASATPMPVADQAPPLFTRLTRSLQQAPSDPAKAFLVCTAERPEGAAPQDHASAPPETPTH